MLSRHISGETGSATRRTALKGLGFGLVGGRALSSTVGEVAAAERSGNQGRLGVSNVEVGQVTLTGGWEKRTEIENNTSDGYFDVRFDVEGCEPSSQGVQLAYNAAAISTTDGEIAEVQGSGFAEETTSGSVTVVHGNRATHAFRTGLPGVEWSDGRYEVQVAVSDVNQRAYAGGVSQSFRIR
jgi:hypothetical protein